MTYNNFKSFDTGIRIAPGLASDPPQGRLFEIYANTTRSVLRICVNETPLTWRDLSIGSGSVDKSTLHWDIGTKTWVENVSLLTDGAKIYAPPTIGSAGLDFEVDAGDSDTNAAGGNLYLRGGMGLSSRGNIMIDSPEISALTTIAGIGVDLLVKAGDSTAAATIGANITLEAGTGTGAARGNANVSGNKVNLQADQAINVGAQHDTDPVSAIIGDTYFNTLWNQFRQYSASGWDFVGLKGVGEVMLFDDSHTTLPTNNLDLVDGQTIQNTSVVVFAALSVDPGYYYATVSAPSVFWTKFSAMADPTGSFFWGDRIVVRFGTVHGLSEKIFDGSNWVTDISSNSGNLQLKAASGYAKITGTVLNLDIAQPIDPISANTQDVYYNSNTSLFKYWDGTQWKTMGIPAPTTVPFLDNTTANILYTTLVTSVNMLGIEYSIVRDTERERGVLRVAADPISLLASCSATGSNLGDPLVDFYASVDGSGNLNIYFDAEANGFSGSIEYVVLSSWLHN